MDSQASVLVLGSMPGVASLEAGEYYAHPRNAFWPLLGELLGFDSGSPYEQRCDALREARVAVWDVLMTCERRGSLDASIVPESEQPNDLGALLADCPAIERVLFNGAKAEAAFKRHVEPWLDATLGRRVERRRLPSTSPANASWSYERKLGAWRAAMLGG